MEGEGIPADGDAIRFEDLTVDDLPNWALHQLPGCSAALCTCEDSELAGADASQSVLLPAIQGLVTDPESEIWQHIAAQLLPLSVVCMVEPA
jgi:hypothetical protein